MLNQWLAGFHWLPFLGTWIEVLCSLRPKSGRVYHFKETRMVASVVLLMMLLMVGFGAVFVLLLVAMMG